MIQWTSATVQADIRSDPLTLTGVTASNVPAGALPYRAVITVGGQRIEVDITVQSR